MAGVQLAAASPAVAASLSGCEFEMMITRWLVNCMEPNLISTMCGPPEMRFLNVSTGALVFLQLNPLGSSIITKGSLS